MVEPNDPNTGNSMKNRAKETAQKAGDKARDIAGQAREKASDLGHQAKEKASDLAHQARDAGGDMLRDQKHAAAERMKRFGSVFHETADRFREQDDSNIAGYADALGERIERAGNYIDNKELGELFDDVQSAARRHPEIFIGGMFFAGLALARFLKATEQPRHGAHGMEGYEGNYAGDYPSGYATGTPGSGLGTTGSGAYDNIAEVNPTTPTTTPGSTTGDVTRPYGSQGDQQLGL